MSTGQHIQSAEADFHKVIDHLKTEFSRLQAGRASANLLDGVQVSAYGVSQELKAVAGVTVTDSKTIQIKPWDKGVLGDIEKAIINSNLGLNPVNDGELIRIVMPALTEERRRDLTKNVHRLAEDARISVRNIRQKVQTRFKEEKANGELTEDDMHGAEKKLQEKVDAVNKEIEELARVKEQDIMTV